MKNGKAQHFKNKKKKEIKKTPFHIWIDEDDIGTQVTSNGRPWQG